MSKSNKKNTKKASFGNWINTGFDFNNFFQDGGAVSKKQSPPTNSFGLLGVDPPPKSTISRYEALWNPIFKKHNLDSLYNTSKREIFDLERAMAHPNDEPEAFNDKDQAIPRNIPPLDPVLKEMQQKLINMSDQEISKILNGKYNIGSIITGNLPTGVSRADVFKYKNHIKKLRKEGYTFKNGGVIKDKDINVANNGYVTQIGDNSISPTMLFNGPSHANGGINVAYGGQQVEVEGGEPYFKDSENNLQIFGKLKVPGLNKTFKSVIKDIAKEETKTSKLLDKSMDLVNNNNPHNKYQKYAFNSGMVMGQYASNRQAELTATKEDLAELQDFMLSLMDDESKAKWGKKMKYAKGGEIGPGDGKSLAQRHNNPGNIKYAKWLEKYGAKKGQAAKDGGYFAEFPNVDQGQAAMIELLNKPLYRNKTVRNAIKTWTGGSTYSNIPEDIADLPVSSLSQSAFKKLLDTITVGEDSKKYNWEGVTTNDSDGYHLPEVEVKAPRIKQTIPAPDEKLPLTLSPFVNVPQDTVPTGNTPPSKPLGNLDIPNRKRLPSLADQNKLSFGQIAPELLMLATERRQFVPGQRYTPQLYTPYQVSFQDQLNQNQATFSDVARRTGNNPSALGALAAQKYNADSQVISNEFRTNQEISNQITNQNTSLLNQAELTNLELQDRQFVRQTQANANTRSNVFGAINSISNKFSQNKAENNTMRLYENMFNFRPDEDLQLDYMGPDPYFTGGTPPQGVADNQSTRTVYDRNGNVMRSTVNTPSRLRTAQDQYKAERQRRFNVFNLF
jgi:hypothetical protein